MQQNYFSSSSRDASSDACVQKTKPKGFGFPAACDRPSGHLVCVRARFWWQRTCSWRVAHGAPWKSSLLRLARPIFETASSGGAQYIGSSSCAAGHGGGSRARAIRLPRSSQQSLRWSVDLLWEPGHHHFRPAPTPAAVAELWSAGGTTKSHATRNEDESTVQVVFDGGRVSRFPHFVFPRAPPTSTVAPACAHQFAFGLDLELFGSPCRY